MRAYLTLRDVLVHLKILYIFSVEENTKTVTTSEIAEDEQSKIQSNGDTGEL